MSSVPPSPLEIHDELTPTDGPDVADAIMATAQLATDDANTLASIETICRGVERRWDRERQARDKYEADVGRRIEHHAQALVQFAQEHATRAELSDFIAATQVVISGLADEVRATRKLLEERDEDVAEAMRAQTTAIERNTQQVGIMLGALREAGILKTTYSEIADNSGA